jgi:hypothetical protein
MQVWVAGGSRFDMLREFSIEEYRSSGRLVYRKSMD